MNLEVYEKAPKPTTSREQIETNPSKKLKSEIMASGKKVTASGGSINWEAVRRKDPEAYYEFHDEDDELDTLALLRGIHNIQEAGGDGAAEQRFLDRVGFKPLPVANSVAAASDASAQTRGEAAAGRANMTLNEAEEWAHELSVSSTPPPARVPLHRRQETIMSPEPSAPLPQSVTPPEPYEGSAMQREVAQLTEVVADLDVPGAPPSITLPQAFVSERAFAAHVNGRVREAVEEACAAFECERAEWRRTEATYRRELLSENRLLEAVLRKYKVSIPAARAALAELDAAEPIEPPVAHPVSPATALSPVGDRDASGDALSHSSMESDPSYVRFATMATRGRPRRRRGKRGGAWCAP